MLLLFLIKDFKTERFLFSLGAKETGGDFKMPSSKCHIQNQCTSLRYQSSAPPPICGRREGREWREGAGAHLGVSVMFVDSGVGCTGVLSSEDKSSDMICALFCVYVILP